MTASCNRWYFTCIPWGSLCSSKLVICEFFGNQLLFCLIKKMMSIYDFEIWINITWERELQIKKKDNDNVKDPHSIFLVLSWFSSQRFIFC